MNDRTEELLRNDSNSRQPIESNKKYNNSKRRINGICRSLCIESMEYKPIKTIDSIHAYLRVKDKLDRILYSEISSYVFSLEENSRGSFASNIEKLLLYSLDDANNLEDDCKKIIVKIFDHFHLALHQIENANHIFDESVETAKKKIRNETKGIEREYISILGIFAAIVLAFVGGITFSSSVLQNISSISIYRLLIVVDLLGFVLTNVLYMLMNFILEINEKKMSFFKIWILNFIFGGIALILIIMHVLEKYFRITIIY